LEFFPDTTEFEVLHLDHEKPYFVPEKWRKNKAQADARLARGLSSAIEQDRFACESLRRQANG